MPPAMSVRLLLHDPAWAELASKEAGRLEREVCSIIRVDHIGSTSVPGIAAKPVIDLIPTVTALAELDEERAGLELLGYEWHGAFGIEGRRYCTLSDPQTGERIINMHCFALENPGIRRHLAF